MNILEDLSTQPQLLGGSEGDKAESMELCCIILSKCHYYINSYLKALYYALNSGKYFNIENTGQYEITIISKAIQTYIMFSKKKSIEGDSVVAGGEQKQSSGEKAASYMEGVEGILSEESVKRLEAVVNQLLDKSLKEGNYKQVIGIIIEARNIQKLEVILNNVLLSSGRTSDNAGVSLSLLSYCLENVVNNVKERAFRNAVFKILISIYQVILFPSDSESTSIQSRLGNEQAGGASFSSLYLELFICLYLIGDVKNFGFYLNKLISTPESAGTSKEVEREKELIAYQLAFDIVEMQDITFLKQLFHQIPSPAVASSVEIGRAHV